MQKLKSKEFWSAALFRAMRTLIQTAAAGLAAGSAFKDIDWGLLGVTSLLAAMASLLTSVTTGLPEVNDEADLPEVK